MMDKAVNMESMKKKIEKLFDTDQQKLKMDFAKYWNGNAHQKQQDVVWADVSSGVFMKLKQRNWGFS